MGGMLEAERPAALQVRLIEAESPVARAGTNNAGSPVPVQQRITGVKLMCRVFARAQRRGEE
jgi:hypothetical protein